MSLRDAFTAIALGHRPTTHQVRSKLRPDVYYNEPACRDCEWTGTGSLMEAHAAHVADLQIAYLREHLAEHAEELGMTIEKYRSAFAPDDCDYDRVRAVSDWMEPRR